MRRRKAATISRLSINSFPIWRESEIDGDSAVFALRSTSAVVLVSVVPSAQASAIHRRRELLVARPIITLTTDYGTNDHLVGTLKGVILRINPEATIVDITHNVAPYDLLDAALAIGSAYWYFPPRTFHVVVVDPGVGTER